MLSKQTRADAYEQITAALIAAIEEGTGTFEMPWHTCVARSMPRTRNSTAALTSLCFGPPSRKDSYFSHEWATYRQWNALGAQAERSTLVVFCKFFDSAAKEDQTGGCQRYQPPPSLF
jgi:antirestriction protein ArdC